MNLDECVCIFVVNIMNILLIKSNGKHLMVVICMFISTLVV